MRPMCAACSTGWMKLWYQTRMAGSAMRCLLLAGSGRSLRPDHARRHSIVVNRAGKRRKRLKVRAHFMTNRRVQRLREGLPSVAHHLVALHGIQRSPGQQTYRVEAGVDLELAKSGKANHVRG